MRETRSKNFLNGDRNFKKYQIDLKNNGWKLMVTALALTLALFYVGVTTTWGLQEQKTF